MSEPEMEPTLFSDLPEQGQVDGRADEADRREESRHRVRVRAAVADYLGKKRRRR